MAAQKQIVSLEAIHKSDIQTEHCIYEFRDMYMYDTHYMYNMNIITINEKKATNLKVI